VDGDYDHQNRNAIYPDIEPDEFDLPPCVTAVGGMLPGNQNYCVSGSPIF
jgi:hypothetical protein